MEEPSLVEPTTKYFLTDALKKAHETKMSRHSFIFNVVVAAAFFIVFGGFLWYRYQTKPTPIEKALKAERDHAIIMSKIGQYHDERKRRNCSSITDLPFTT